MRLSLEEIAREHDLDLILQFGSTVSGRAHSRSDLDIGVLFGRPKPVLEIYGELLHDLQSHFGPERVDLAVLNTADPLFLRKIMESARMLVGAPRRMAELKIYAYKRYQDHRRFLALERDYVSRALVR